MVHTVLALSYPNLGLIPKWLHYVLVINNENDLINLQILGDKDEKVKYNATKTMVSLGNWSLPAMTIIVRCIKDGDYEMQKDLVKTMINARNVHLVNKVITITIVIMYIHANFEC